MYNKSDLFLPVAGLGAIGEAVTQAAKFPAGSPERADILARVTGSISTETKETTTKEKYRNRAFVLPTELLNEFAAGKMQITDWDIYSHVSIEGQKEVELISNSGAAEIGLRNISVRKLAAKQYFLVTAIGMLYDDSATAETDAALKAANYDAIPPKEVLNGEFELKQESQVLIRRTSCSVFRTHSNEKIGVWVLDNPKMLKPNSEIIPKIYMSGVHNAGTGKYGLLKLVLFGCVNEPVVL